MTARLNAEPPPAALPSIIGALAAQFSRMPGVGEKTGLKYALLIATGEPERATTLAELLNRLHTALGRCAFCGMLAERVGETYLCNICRDHKRDQRLLCVVERVQDVLAIERSGAMRGRYFVLGALIDPLEGRGAEALPIDELRAKVQEGDFGEVLVATNTSTNGEATAMVVAAALRGLVTLSRIASGVPHGGDLEYADQLTIGRAITSRSLAEK